MKTNKFILVGQTEGFWLGCGVGEGVGSSVSAQVNVMLPGITIFVESATFLL